MQISIKKRFDINAIDSDYKEQIIKIDGVIYCNPYLYDCENWRFLSAIL